MTEVKKPAAKRKVNSFVPLETSVSKERQGVLYKQILKHTASGNKLLLKIYSDSYDFQCYAKVEIYDPVTLKWNHLESIPYSLMETPGKLVHSIPFGVKAEVISYRFANDRNTLLNKAKLILE